MVGVAYRDYEWLISLHCLHCPRSSANLTPTKDSFCFSWPPFGAGSAEVLQNMLRQPLFFNARLAFYVFTHLLRFALASHRDCFMRLRAAITFCKRFEQLSFATVFAIVFCKRVSQFCAAIVFRSLCVATCAWQLSTLCFAIAICACVLQFVFCSCVLRARSANCVFVLHELLTDAKTREVLTDVKTTKS